jgi:hypothetical protein
MMGQRLLESAALRGGQSSSVPPIVSDHATITLGKTAQIARHPKIDAHGLRRKLRLHLPETIRCAFPAPSMHRMCEDASRLLGVAPDTVERLYRGTTDKLDVAVVCAIAARFKAVTGKDSPVAQLIMAIVGGAV